LAYFRCTTQRPAIWFWFLGPTGRSGVGSCWPLKIALFEIGQMAMFLPMPSSLTNSF
jgi:hypothetical protein